MKAFESVNSSCYTRRGDEQARRHVLDTVIMPPLLLLDRLLLLQLLVSLFIEQHCRTMVR